MPNKKRSLWRRLFPLFIALAIAALLPFFLLAVWRRTLTIRVYFDDEYAVAAAKALLNASPLPASIAAVFVHLDDTEKTALAEKAGEETALFVQTKDWRESDWRGEEQDGKRLAIQRYAPSAPFWDERISVSFDAIKNALLLPLDEIALPRKALAVDGVYASEADYPLDREIYLFYQPGKAFPPAKAFDELTSWYSGLMEAAPASYSLAWIASVGDLMLGRGADKLLEEEGAEAVFIDLLPLFKEQDLLLGNLEGAVTESGKAASKSYTFRFPSAVLPVLKTAGFDYLSVANNHSFDYGKTGFTDTLAALNKAGLATSGAGKKLEEALKPWRTIIQRQRISLFSLAAYPAEGRMGFDGEKETKAGPDAAGVLWADESTLALIAGTFTSDYFDIVMIHGGMEWRDEPTEEQRALYQDLIDRGADLVLGSHPHVLQGMEARDNKLICHSLGNFVFAGMDEMPNAEDSVLLSLGLMAGRIVYLHYYPVKINGPTVALGDGGRTAERFSTLSQKLGGKY